MMTVTVELEWWLEKKNGRNGRLIMQLCSGAVR
jgi:hypothetical protein